MEQEKAKPKHHHHITAQKDRVPFFQKAIYSIGAFANTSQAAFIGQMVIVLNLGLGVNPALVGLAGAIPRIVDAISDPVTGYVSDNIRTRWGRRRPLIFIGAIAGGIFYALMFQLFPGRSQIFYFAYFLIFQILYFIGFTIFSIPWIALGYEMTPDYHERTRLQGSANLVGQLPWFIAPWCWAIMHNQNWFPEGIVQGGRNLAIIIGTVIISFGIMPAIFNREYFHTQPQADTKDDKEVLHALPKSRFKGVWKAFKDFFGKALITLRCKPFVKLCVSTLLIFGGFMCASAFTIYVVFFYVFGKSPSLDQAYGSGGVLLGWYGMFSALCTMGAIYLATRISTKIGKRNTFFITIPISVLGFALKWVGYSQTNPYLLFISAPFIGFCLGPLFTLMSSMVADVCDYDELQTGQRREGMFGAIYWWMVKLGVALSSFISGLLINATGFRQEIGLAQPTETMFWMRICDIGIPIVTSIIAIFILMTFSITEDRAYEIRAEAERRRGERRMAAEKIEEERRRGERRKED